MTSNVETHRSGTLRSWDTFSKRRIVQEKKFRDTLSWYQEKTSFSCILSNKMAKIVRRTVSHLPLNSSFHQLIQNQSQKDFWCLSLTTILRLVSGASYFVGLFSIKKALHLQVCYCSHNHSKCFFKESYSSSALIKALSS